MLDAGVIYTSSVVDHRNAVIDYTTETPGSKEPLQVEPMRVATFCSCGQPLAGFAATATRCPGCGAIWILGSPMRIG